MPFHEIFGRYNPCRWFGVDLSMKHIYPLIILFVLLVNRVVPNVHNVQNCIVYKLSCSIAKVQNKTQCLFTHLVIMLPRNLPGLAHCGRRIDVQGMTIGKLVEGFLFSKVIQNMSARPQSRIQFETESRLQKSDQCEPGNLVLRMVQRAKHDEDPRHLAQLLELSKQRNDSYQRSCMLAKPNAENADGERRTTSLSLFPVEILSTGFTFYTFLLLDKLVMPSDRTSERSPDRHRKHRHNSRDRSRRSRSRSREKSNRDKVSHWLK